MTTLEAEISTTMERPETEIERQERVVAQLGDDFEFPLFNGRHAIESQRKSAYKNTARAAREIIDNAYEAGAQNVWVVFDRPNERGREKNQRRDAVGAIAFIDNGPGMIPKMARFALSWGGGSHFENPTGIGRFGFGLPNSSINQTRRVEVYTRTSADDPWIRAVLDITPDRLKQIPASGLVKVDEPQEAELPAFVADYVKRQKIEIGTGTVVVWDKPDRIQPRGGAKLRELMLDDFGVSYRYLLDKFKIVVDSVQVKKVDPLFLTPDAMYYKAAEDGGAISTLDRELPVKYYRDPETGSQHLELLDSAEALRDARIDPAVEAIGTISVRLARFPYGFAGEKIDGRVVDKDTDEFRRLQIRRKRRGISYVRAAREIDFVDNLPTSASDRAAGLGEWPILQAYAMHWGLEVRFSPSLDEALGIGNDKQTINPTEDFWRVLVQAEVDKSVRQEELEQREIRNRKTREAAKKQAEDPNVANPAIEAAAQAEQALGRQQPLPAARIEESKGRFKEAVQQRVAITGEDVAKAEEAVRREAERKKYGIGFFTSEGGVFFKPDFGNGLQRMALINTAHPFFQTFYAGLTTLPDPKPRQAIDLVLLTLAKSELEADDQARLMLAHKREAEWSPFLKLGLTILEQLQVGDPEQDDET
ncbi:MAG: ATP-binding protein [Phycisphaerales bacterium]|nr:ATP-binding protein [Phycisphaerales bacterium]